MELKTYQGKSMAEALDKVKKDLGRGAVILHTRTIRRGGLMGVGARSIVEITASRDPSLLPKPDRPGMPVRRDTQPTGGTHRESAAMPPRFRPEGPSPARAAEASAVSKLATPNPDALTQISTSTSALRNEMEELRTMVRQLLDREQSPRSAAAALAGTTNRTLPPIPDELRDYYTKLIQNAVADELAREVVARAKDRLNEWRGRLQAVGAAKAEPLDFQQLIPNALLEVIERMLPPADPVQLLPGKGTKFVALVGPTGVGKTTTIAKLAAQFKLRERKRVALITTDTYRIAAVAQLKAYAEILSVPLEVVYTPAELTDTMRKLSSYDVVLVDTSGRSQNDTEHLGDLQAFLTTAREAAKAMTVTDEQAPAPAESAGEAKPASEQPYSPLETHLVMSCTAHSTQLQRVLEKFSNLGIDRVVFTKLDEAVGVGVILNIANRLDVQLSYLTTGQDVPDDIEVGSRRRIAEMVLDLRPAAAPVAAASTKELPPTSAVNHLA